MNKEQFAEAAPFAQIVTLANAWPSSGILIGGLVFQITGPDLSPAPSPDKLGNVADGSQAGQRLDWAEYFVAALRGLRPGIKGQTVDEVVGDYLDEPPVADFYNGTPLPQALNELPSGDPRRIMRAAERLRAYGKGKGARLMSEARDICREYLAATDACHGDRRADPTDPPPPADPAAAETEWRRFAIWLTTRGEPVVAGRSFPVYPMIAAVEEWAKMQESKTETGAPADRVVEVSDGDLLRTMGTDGQLWARHFELAASRQKDPFDPGFLLTWFASAIEAGRTAGQQELPLFLRLLDERSVGIIARALSSYSERVDRPLDIELLELSQEFRKWRGALDPTGRGASGASRTPSAG